MAQGHSFDIVCKLDLQEVRNAIQQTRKELATRFDFKGSKARVELEKDCITLSAEDDFRLKALADVLESKLVKRSVPLKALIYKDVEQASLGSVRQRIEFQQGIPIEKAREIVKIVKGTKRKVQVAIQGDQVRASAKKIDDLQFVMGLLKEKDLGIEMQFVNYRSGLPMGLTEIVLRPIRRKLAALETTFRDELRSDVPIIEQVNAHIAKQSGKRVRPTLLLLSAQMAGYEGEGDVTLAAVVEFIHTATLIHDDIIDGAAVRRGQRSVNAVWGNNLSVLLGDYLYVMALELALKERRLRILDVLTQATRAMTEGELMEVAAAGDLELDQDRYLEIIKRKTAALFGASSQLAGVLADLDPEGETALANYGFNVGMAFQLIDDVLDFLGNEKTLGKPVVSDLVEGKLTLPAILLLERASDKETALVKRIVAEGRASAQEQAELVASLERHGTLESAQRLAAEYGRRALKGLVLFEDSPAKRILERVPELLLSRST